ncbi:Aldehyde/histidinol dehydrogenase [Aspergillus stella-maris]|uniref:Aldehyde/histidinol dehydrogenase n=1 Tax=Aspergillus stella-maris TaxID=1810926 RepID=UPI003CCE1E32
MRNQGQICTATSRILVHESLYAEYIAQFLETVRTVSKVGDQWDDSVYQGPQVTRAQYDRVRSLIDVGVSEGAALAMGGQWEREEIFGPVVCIPSFGTEEEAIRRANDTVYGLGAAIFTTDLQRALRVAPAIQAGMVWVNSSQDCDFRIPFGGVKQNGSGRELGEAGLEAYTTVQAIHVNMGWKL